MLVPGGEAFVALMLRLAFVRRTLALDGERRHLLEPDFVVRVLEDGVFWKDVPGRFTSGYGARLGYGFEQLALLSAESVTVGLEAVLPELLADESLAKVVFELAIRSAEDPSILGLARHVLYVGRCSTRG